MIVGFIFAVSLFDSPSLKTFCGVLPFIARPWSGRATRIHALIDTACRPVAFLLTGGQVADCTAADRLLDQVTTADLVQGDKGYDTNAMRRRIEAKGAAPKIPPNVNRR